jgi:hypothetical protein
MDVWYVIDEFDRLTEASDGYFGFAAQNQFSEASADLGKSLWSAVSDDTTRTVQKSLVRRVRRSGRSLALPFRCDSPAVRRELSLEIGVQAGIGWVRFSVWPISEESRPPQALLDSSTPRSDRTITMCSWCDRFMVGRVWVEIERAVEELGLMNGSALPRISYALCDRCGGMLERA